MLQSLAEKESTYTHKWGLRRVVFEPNHRYFFYSDVLDHNIRETREVQEAIAACRDLHTNWKHKVKVTKVLRDIQLHHPPSEAVLQTEDYDVRNFFVLHIEGFRRKIDSEAFGAFGKFTTAEHAAFDGASPMYKNRKENPVDDFESRLAAAVNTECANETVAADDDELALTYDNRNAIATRYTFRFLSQAVFLQWYEKIIQALERDGVADTKYVVDCPKVDPRCNVTIARVPLHLTNTMHVLDQFIFYALLRGTRVVLNDQKHDPHNFSAVALGEVDHLHLLRYQDASRYGDPTYLLLTDNVVYFVRKDGKVVWTLNLIDVEAVWFNTTAAPEPFIVFKNRPPLADLVFLVFHDSEMKSVIGYKDSTLHGPAGAKYFVDVLSRLAPHAAALRVRGERAVYSAPALRQKLESAHRATTTDVKAFPCVGLNIYGSFEEFVIEEGANITWRASTNTASSVIDGRASAMPHVQVAPTPRWKLAKAVKLRDKRLAAEAESKKLKDAITAAKAASASHCAPPSPPLPPSLGVSPHGSEPLLSHPHEEGNDVGRKQDDEDLAAPQKHVQTQAAQGSQSPPPPPAAPRRPVHENALSASVHDAHSPVGLQRKPSNISKVLLTPLQRVSSLDGAATPPPRRDTDTMLQGGAPQIPAPASGEDLLGLFSPKLVQKGQPQKNAQLPTTNTTTTTTTTNGAEDSADTSVHPPMPSIVLDDSFDDPSDEIDDDDL